VPNSALSVLKLLLRGRAMRGERSFHMNAEMPEVTRQRFQKVIPCVTTCRPKGRREETGAEGSETMLTSGQWLSKWLLGLAWWLVNGGQPSVLY